MKLFGDIEDRDVIYVITPNGDVIELDVIREGNNLILSDDSYDTKEVDITKALGSPCITFCDGSAFITDVEALLIGINHLRNKIKETLIKLDKAYEIYKEKQV